MLLVFALVVTGCAPPVVADERVDLTSGWLVRHGDSPRDDSGRLTWLDAGDDGWSPAKMPDYVTTKTKRLWLKVRLPAHDIEEPWLMIDPPVTAYEAYLDGERIDAFGGVDDAEELSYGSSWRLVPLPPGAAGRVLMLRVRSTYFLTGIHGQVVLGSRGSHLNAIVKADMGRALTGLVGLLLGLAALIAGLWRRKDRHVALTFAAYAIGAACTPCTTRS